MDCDYLVVGAGFFGSVVAERIANDLGKKVAVIDKRPHIGGNCYSVDDPVTGIEYHKYGAHIFHTSSPKAWAYINRFTRFNGYHHQGLSHYKGRVYQLPINLETINSFYNLNLTPEEAKKLIASEIAKENIGEPRNLEEHAIKSIGRPLYEAFIKGYTAKQWGKDPKELPAKIIARLPVRYNYNEDYFKNADWQGIPMDGYTKVFDRMLDHPNITVELNCDYFERRGAFKVKEKTIYTGPIDRYFDYRFGRLEWRTVVFEKKHVDVEDFQGTTLMHYPEESVPYTRIYEPRHLHAERDYPRDRTVIFYEYSKRGDDDPFYPINTDTNVEKFQKYKALAAEDPKLVIGGRLGDYAYYDMDKTILAALKCYEEKIAK